MRKPSPEGELLSVNRTKIFGTIPMLPEDIRDRLFSYSKAFGVSQEAMYLRVFRKVLLMKGIAKPYDPSRQDTFHWWVPCQKEIDRYCSNAEAKSQLFNDIQRALTEVGVEYSRDGLENLIQKKLSDDARNLFDEVREDLSIYHPFSHEELKRLIRLSASALNQYVMSRLTELQEAEIDKELSHQGFKDGKTPIEGRPGDRESSSQQTKPVRRADLLTSVKQYLTACEVGGTEYPTLKDLEDFSGRTTSFWSKTLIKDPFLMLLKKAIDKKINSAKTDDTKEFWTGALISVANRADRATARVRKSTKSTSWREKRQADISELPEHPEDVKSNRFDTGLYYEPPSGSEEDS